MYKYIENKIEKKTRNKNVYLIVKQYWLISVMSWQILTYNSTPK